MATDAEKFFYKHAGYSYPSGATPAQQRAARRASAKRMAAAEARASALGWYYEWEYDREPDVSWMDEKALADYEAGRTEMLEVVLKDENGKVLDSLGGVHVRATGRDPYIRVAEAELALEALSRTQRANDNPWARFIG